MLAVGCHYKGEIKYSFAGGKVTCEDNSGGGLVGKNDEGLIHSSYAAGEVTGNERIGGLVGYNNQGSISSSYAVGTARGNERVGGLVGEKHAGQIINSYAIGPVNVLDEEARYYGGLTGSNYSSITNSYYNTITTGMDDTGKGEPRNTSEMTYPYAENTYVDWDFSTVWQAGEDYTFNNGYPFLQWQDR